MTTPETVGQFADAVRAAVDAERERIRERIKAIVGTLCENVPTVPGLYCSPREYMKALRATQDELLRRIEEGL